MTQDEIDTLWQQAMYQAIKEGELFTRYQFAKLAAAKEREACVGVCEQSGIPIPIDVWLKSTKKEISKHTALALAAAIRARGEQA